MFAFDKTKILVLYAQVEKRNVLLLDTRGLFYNKNLSALTKKLEIIDFYSNTKTGTDALNILEHVQKLMTSTFVNIF